MADTCALCGHHYMAHGSKNQCPGTRNWKPKFPGDKKPRFTRNRKK